MRTHKFVRVLAAWTLTSICLIPLLPRPRHVNLIIFSHSHGVITIKVKPLYAEQAAHRKQQIERLSTRLITGLRHLPYDERLQRQRVRAKSVDPLPPFHQLTEFPVLSSGPLWLTFTIINRTQTCSGFLEVPQVLSVEANPQQ